MVNRVAGDERVTTRLWIKFLDEAYDVCADVILHSPFFVTDLPASALLSERER
jgi:hypothetical protein